MRDVTGLEEPKSTLTPLATNRLRRAIAAYQAMHASQMDTASNRATPSNGETVSFGLLAPIQISKLLNAPTIVVIVRISFDTILRAIAFDLLTDVHGAQ